MFGSTCDDDGDGDEDQALAALSERERAERTLEIFEAFAAAKWALSAVEAFAKVKKHVCHGYFSNFLLQLGDTAKSCAGFVQAFSSHDEPGEECFVKDLTGEREDDARAGENNWVALAQHARKVILPRLGSVGVNGCIDMKAAKALRSCPPLRWPHTRRAVFAERSITVVFATVQATGLLVAQSQS